MLTRQARPPHSSAWDLFWAVTAMRRDLKGAGPLGAESRVCVALRLGLTSHGAGAAKGLLGLPALRAQACPWVPTAHSTAQYSSDLVAEGRSAGAWCIAFSRCAQRQ